MWRFWKRILTQRSWNNRKIAFVSILIATSVAFVLVFTSIVPIAAIPSFRLMAGGLPVKLTGYIFGPFIGAITGTIADLISFAFRPSYYYWWYTMAWMMAGLIPGVVSYLMNRKWKPFKETQAKDDTKYNDFNFLVTLIVLVTIILGLFILIISLPNEVFAKQKLITNHWVFLGITTAGSSTMLIGILIFRIFLKPKTFNSLLPIIVFSALLELVTTPLMTLGDQSALFTTQSSFLLNLTGHLLLSPVKIWSNMIIIFVAYKIVAPLIYNKTSNGW